MSYNVCTKESPSHEFTGGLGLGGSGLSGGNIGYKYTGEKIIGCAEKNCPDRQPGGFNAPKNVQPIPNPIVEPPKVEPPKVDTPKVDTPKVETPKVDSKGAKD